MKLEDLIKRADELLQLGKTTLATASETRMGTYVGLANFCEFRAAVLAFVKQTFGADSPYYEDFDAFVPENAAWNVERGMGILKACREELAGGWVFTTRGLVSAEVFSDFLSMAEHLLGEGYKDAAAVMVGSVLEEHLRQLCKKNSIPIEAPKPDGTLAPLKADTLNSELSKAGIYSKLDVKNVTAWLDLRNKAAHGKYGEYNADQVGLVLQGVSTFIARTPL
jgi:hypothetical protein